MSTTQKGAWFLLGGTVLSLTCMGIVYAALFAGGDRLAGTGLVRFCSGLIVVFTIAGAVLVHRKQSPAEPESDERDNAIKKNAVLACFISVWVSLVLASFIPTLVVGDNGSIPVFLLPLINIVILYVAFLVYGVAVLVQYERAAKEESQLRRTGPVDPQASGDGRVRRALALFRHRLRDPLVRRWYAWLYLRRRDAAGTSGRGRRVHAGAGLGYHGSVWAHFMGDKS